jgi:hypothetical protein
MTHLFNFSIQATEKQFDAIIALVFLLLIFRGARDLIKFLMK